MRTKNKIRLKKRERKKKISLIAMFERFEKMISSISYYYIGNTSFVMHKEFRVQRRTIIDVSSNERLEDILKGQYYKCIKQYRRMALNECLFEYTYTYMNIYIYTHIYTYIYILVARERRSSIVRKFFFISSEREERDNVGVQLASKNEYLLVNPVRCQKWLEMPRETRGTDRLQIIRK